MVANHIVISYNKVTQVVEDIYALRSLGDGSPRQPRLFGMGVVGAENFVCRQGS